MVVVRHPNVCPAARGDAMSPPEAKYLVALIYGAYPTQAARLDEMATASMIATWTDLLEDAPFAEAKQAVKRWCKHSQWMPSVANILGEIVDASSKAVSAGVAWERVLREIGSKGGDREPELPALILRAVNAIGGWRAICRSESPMLAQKFVEAYERERSDMRTAAMAGDKLALRALAEAPNKRLATAESPLALGAGDEVAGATWTPWGDEDYSP